MASFSSIANSLGSALQKIGTYSANSAAKANAVSAASQSAQGAFNQASADNANTLNNASIANQYGFNSAMMQSANSFNTQAWQNAASWNEEMFERQMDFNREEAQKQRDWQTAMSNTQYQRAMADMQKAGLNPILAYGGIGGGVPGGSAASVSSPTMGATTGNMASGGLLGASTASESNYMGQMEQMGTTLALLGAIFAGISSAADAAGGLGQAGEDIMKTVSDVVTGVKTGKDTFKDSLSNYWNWGKSNQENPNYKSNWRNGIDWNMKNYNFSKNDGSREMKFRIGHAKG